MALVELAFQTYSGLSSNKVIVLYTESFITISPCNQTEQEPKCFCDCGTLWHYGTSLLSSPRVHRTGEDVITTDVTLIADFEALCKKVEREKKATYFTSRGFP